MAAHKYYETMKGKDGIGIQYVYHVSKKGKRIITHLICAALPQNLTIPIAYLENCVAHHASIATKLQEIQCGK